MTRFCIALLLLFSVCTRSFAQDYDKPCFPVKEMTGGKSAGWFIDCKDPQTVKRYEGVFKKNRYSFTPEVLQGILEQALEKYNPELAKDVTFSADETQLHIDVKKGSRDKFFEFNCTTFSSASKLEDYIIKADRSQIDNEGNQGNE